MPPQEPVGKDFGVQLQHSADMAAVFQARKKGAACFRSRFAQTRQVAHTAALCIWSRSRRGHAAHAVMLPYGILVKGGCIEYRAVCTSEKNTCVQRRLLQTCQA